MSYKADSEFLEWELEQVDHADDEGFGLEEETWVRPGDTRSPDEPVRPGPRSTPHNWRQHREMLSPLEGAHHEQQAEEDQSSPGGRFNPSEESPRSDASSPQHQSGGEKFQALDDGFGDGETYFYDEDMTRRNPNSDPRSHDTRSNADLIFRGPTTTPIGPKRMFFRYLVVAFIALAVGFFIGFLTSEATKVGFRSTEAVTTTNVVNLSATRLVTPTESVLANTTHAAMNRTNPTTQSLRKAFKL